MAESRAKRMQIVLMLAERDEQKLGALLGQCRTQVEAEIGQLHQLDDYATQYLQQYSERKSAVKAHELIAYSSFIQRLGDARKEQQMRVERAERQLNEQRARWHLAHQKCESIKKLIEKLFKEDIALQDKRVQKEIDEMITQAFSQASEIR